MTATVPIIFYIHPKFWPRIPFPSSPDEGWSGYNFGVYCWTIQTYQRLKAAGYDCELHSSVPREGIVFAHRECLEVDGEPLLPGPRRLLVNLAADLDLYPRANLQIVQNPMQEAWYYGRCHFMPHWPEPSLVPRDEDAGPRFRTLAYLGNEKSLAPELRTDSWLGLLSSLGLRWVAKTGFFSYDDASTYCRCGAWSDYHDIDAIVAVRRFAAHPGAFSHKPASKLVNAWLAGVPAVLGCETAYTHFRYGPLDYADVHTFEELTKAIRLLARCPDLVRQMRQNGFERAKSFSVPAICDR